MPEHELRLNPEQENIYFVELESIRNKKGKIFFFDAPGGTGTTFLLNPLLSKVRTKENRTCCCIIWNSIYTVDRKSHSSFNFQATFKFGVQWSWNMSDF